MPNRQTEIRTFQGGELITERRGNREIPPGTAPVCTQNRLPQENACYQFGNYFITTYIVIKSYK